MGYNGLKLHPVAGKCGVFAETDINGLQKQGVPPDELMASLFEAIVMQNLSVLTRGNTLRPWCCCWAAPTPTSRACASAGRHNIPKIWDERNYPLPEGVDRRRADHDPENAQYFAAIGAVEFGKTRRRRRRPVRRLRQAGVVHHRRPRRGESQEAAAPAALAKDAGRAGRVQGEVPHQEVHRRRRSSPGEVVRRLHRPRRRLDLHQGRADRQGPQASSARPTSSPRATRSRTPRRSWRSSTQQVTRPGRDA